MGVYDRQIKSVKRMIEKYGQSVTWRQVRNGAPADANEPWKPGTPTTTDNETSIAFFPFTSSSMAVQRYRNGSDIPEGTLYGIMDSVDFDPKLKDEIIRDGKTMNVIQCDPLNPNGEGAIIYELEIGI